MIVICDWLGVLGDIESTHYTSKIVPPTKPATVLSRHRSISELLPASHRCLNLDLVSFPVKSGKDQTAAQSLQSPGGIEYEEGRL